MDEEAWRVMIPSAGLYDLLRHPLGRRMLGHLDMQDFADGVVDHEEDTEGPEKDRLDAERVCPKLLELNPGPGDEVLHGTGH